jgi:DNA-binding NarL/FixJ family response regulator
MPDKKTIQMFNRLQPRQIEVIGMLASGYTTQEIGELLNIKEQTIKNHVDGAKKRITPRPTRDRLVALYVAIYGLP